MNEYIYNQQKLIDQAHNNFKNKLSQVESIYQLFQYNKYTMEYLDGTYQLASENVYNLIKFIRPVYSFIYASNQDIQNVKIYSIDPDIFTIGPEFATLNDLIQNQPEYLKIKALKPIEGLWVLEGINEESPPHLSYYQKIYNNDYSKLIGILEIKTSDNAIVRFIEKVKVEPDDQVIVYKNNQMICNYSSIPDVPPDNIMTVTELTDSNRFTNPKKRKLLESRFYIDFLDVQILSYTNMVNIKLENENDWLFLVAGFCLITLSFIYYWITVTLTQKILQLANHMRNVDLGNVSEFDGNIPEKDEIGFLAYSYNAMLRRINELVNTVHKVELLKMEADYKVLQAQIKPHFLYNTLESIRMLAEVTNAEKVENFLSTFSKFIRYSFSNDQYDTTLLDELEHVKNYLRIHKNRVGNRLDYKIIVTAEIKHIICPRFIIQPIVENSIIHGLNKSLQRCVIQIRIFESQSYTVIEVEDNGMGIDEERLQNIREVLGGNANPLEMETSSGGIGLYNVHERIKAYYGKESGIKITSHHGIGTICTIKMYKGG